MRIRASLVVGLFVSAFTVAAGIPTAVGASAPVRPAASAPTAPGNSLRISTAAPHLVDVSRLPAASRSIRPTTRLPLLVRDPAAYAAAKKSPKGRPGIAINRPTTAPSGARQSQVSNFIKSFSGINSATSSALQGFQAQPPDTQMAAGATRILEMVNDTGQVFDKNGNAITNSFLLSDFFFVSFFNTTYFSGEGLVLSDPRVLYDSSTGRWYATILAYNPSTFDSGVILAISTTSNPAATYNVYLVDHQSGLVCDQPKLGYSSDKFVVGCSDFNSSGFQGGVITVTSKAEGLAGSNITIVNSTPNAARFGMVPAQNLDASATAYIAFNQNPAPAAAGLIKLTGTLANGAGTISLTTASVPMNATLPPPTAPQRAATTTIDTGDDRFMSAVVQGGVLYTSGGERCTPATDTAARACLRLVEISLAGPTLVQGATAGVVGKYLVDPTLGLNASGEVVLDYTLTSLTDYPDLEFTIQPVGDPNTFVGGGVLIAGSGPYMGNPPTGTVDRWGDYGAAAVDPAISAYIWVAGEYSNGMPAGTITTWGTEIAEVYPHLIDCTVGTLTASPASPSAPGTPITITANGGACASGLSTETPEYQFWIKPPGGTLTMVQSYSPTNTYNWSGQVTLGTYTLEVLVRGSTETAKAWDAYATTTYVINATPCNTPTLAANPSSPQIAGTPVLLTATTTCGTTPLYQFWVATPDHVLHMLHDYSTSATYNWTTLDTQIGSYTLEVLVKNTGSLGSYDAYKTLPYSMQLCTAPTLSTGTATSPYTSGSGAITLTATGTCEGTTQYQFYYFDTAWHLIQAYSATTTATWNADYKAGNYTLMAEIRPLGSTAAFVTYITKAFVLNGCSLASVATDKASPQVAGTTVTWTPTPGTCSGTPQYQFWVLSPAGVWTKSQVYGVSNTFIWFSPTTPGTYTVQVWVRNSGANEDPYDNYLSATFVLSLCNTPTLSTSAGSSQASGGGAVTLTATDSCAGGTQFEFFYKDTTGTWHLIGSGYGASNTAMWNADYKAGVYTLQVETRPLGSTATFVGYTPISFTLTGCTVLNMGSDKPSPQSHTATITWTATSTCSGVAQYQFWILSPSGVWTVAQPYSVGSGTFVWSTHPATGNYTVQVWVHNTGANEDSFDLYKSVAFTLT
jgi:hypothetical protein